jgi:hypothetical protein
MVVQRERAVTGVGLDDGSTLKWLGIPKTIWEAALAKKVAEDSVNVIRSHP